MSLVKTVIPQFGFGPRPFSPDWSERPEVMR